MKIQFDDKIKSAAPGLRVVTIEADVDNPATSDELWALLMRAAGDIHDVLEMPEIIRVPASVPHARHIRRWVKNLTGIVRRVRRCAVVL